jgi:hypothetical protein
MHQTSSREEYEQMWLLIKEKWLKYKLKKIVKYIEKQWIVKCPNWQLFLTPPGYAHTNSPIESYNNTIKSSFTNGVRFHLVPALEIFENVISLESSKSYTITLAGKCSKSLEKDAQKRLDSNKIVSNGLKYEYMNSVNSD